MFVSRFLFFLTLAISLAKPCDIAAQDKPNFVWLLSEDNSKHFLKLFDPNGAETPNIQKLADQGLIFERAFSNSPVCSVARTTLITGCYGPRICTQFHRRSFMVPLPAGLKMFPAYLRGAGYYTSNQRKEDYNALGTKQAWDESSANASWRNREQGQPFFHMQSFKTTHEGSLHFGRELMRRTKTSTDPESVFIPPIHPKTPTFKYTYARYHDRIQAVDREIGAVVDQLEKDGLLETTFIFYFGDHGGVLPGSKGYAYETGLHVPLVVRVPKNFQHLVTPEIGSRLKGFVSFIDFGPTLLHLAGVKVPDQVDGRPFLGPDISIEALESRDEAFGYADRFDEKSDMVRTLRQGKFKYMRSYQPFNFDGLQNNYRYKMLAYTEWRELFAAGSLNEVQSQFFLPRAAEALYNVEADPYETKNLASDDTLQPILTKLRDRLTQHVKQTHDLSFIPEHRLEEESFADPSKFGEQESERISRYVDIANLSLLEFDEAEESIVNALRSKHPGDRYWAAIVCSGFGDSAESMIAVIKRQIADERGMVKVRMAEFLALRGAVDPTDILLDQLAGITSEVEANLVLNTLVLLRDGPGGYQFDLNDPRFDAVKKMKGQVVRRIDYLTDKIRN